MEWYCLVKFFDQLDGADIYSDWSNKVMVWKDGKQWWAVPTFEVEIIKTLQMICRKQSKRRGVFLLNYSIRTVFSKVVYIMENCEQRKMVYGNRYSNRYSNLIAFLKIVWLCGEQGWRGCQSPRLPSMSRGFDSGPVSCVCWSCCWFSHGSQRLPPRSPVSVLHRNQHLQISTRLG